MLIFLIVYFITAHLFFVIKWVLIHIIPSFILYGSHFANCSVTGADYGGGIYIQNISECWYINNSLFKNYIINGGTTYRGGFCICSCFTDGNGCDDLSKQAVIFRCTFAYCFTNTFGRGISFTSNH